MRRKGILSKILLMLMVIIMVVPTTVFAANEGVTTEVIKNGVLTELKTTGTSYETPTGVTAVIPPYGVTARSLKTLVFGNGVKEIGALAFTPTQSKVESLETVEMKDVEIIGEFAFAGLDKLKSVTLSDNLKEIKVNAFSKTKSLTSIKLPEGLEKIGSEAFAWSGLTSIEIPGTVKKLEQLTFEMNSSLTKVVINEGLEEIAGGAFEKCYNLTEVHIPASVKKMGVGAFSKSGNLTIHTPKGSYAEDYAKKNGIKLANGSTATTKPEPTQPTQPTQPTEPTKPTSKDTRGFKPVENLVGTQKEKIEFGLLKHKPYIDGTYEVELWDDNTKQDLVYTNLDHFILETGYLIKINGKFYAANGLINGNLDDSPSKYETRYDGTGVWTFRTLKAPEKVEIQPMAYGVFSDGKKYTKYSPEVYAYYVYDFLEKGIEDIKPGGIYQEQDLKIKIIKYVNNNTKPTQPERPLAPFATAIPTASKVMVNGKSVLFEAYLINGNNYFKLRDMATVVSGTTKQFEVGWDGSKNAINLLSSKAYTVVGGELAKGDGKNKSGNPTTSKIYKDGKEIKLTAYTINGNNYFKLRDLAQVFDIGVTWDNSTKTIGIDTSIGYTAE